MKTKITYRIRTFLDTYRCIDRYNTICLQRVWKSGGIYYGYKDRFNIVSISENDIISIEKGV